jgi:uncharacterized protein GlcG (DUF336 family)
VFFRPKAAFPCLNGAIIGAIGVSGGTGAQDAQCAAVGAAAIK